MIEYLPPDWKPSEKIVNAARKQGYTKDEIKRRHVKWKQRMIEHAQRKDVRGQLSCETWDAQWYRMITSEEPEAANEHKLKPKRYNAAADPEHNAELERKMKEIYSIDKPGGAERLKKIREQLK